MHKTFVCVGGPHDGRRLCAPADGRLTVVPAIKEQTVTGRTLREARSELQSYEKQRLGTLAQTFEVLVPVGQRPEVTMALLIAGYVEADPAPVLAPIGKPQSQPTRRAETRCL